MSAASSDSKSAMETLAELATDARNTEWRPRLRNPGLAKMGLGRVRTAVEQAQILLPAFRKSGCQRSLIAPASD